MTPIIISPYRIQQEGGVFALMLGNQLLMQASNREDCERMKTSFENSTHAERVLRNTYYDSATNEIRDGIEPR